VEDQQRLGRKYKAEYQSRCMRYGILVGELEDTRWVEEPCRGKSVITVTG
jgi:hypothetical protein